MYIVKQCKCSNAFSLVELLAAIAIIAVLGALIMVGMRSAREASSSVKCAANLRQMGEAVVIYTTDNNGYLPQSRTGWSEGDYWVWWLYANPKWNCPYRAPSGEYLTSSPVICPAMFEKGCTNSRSAGGEGFYFTYAINSVICTDGANGKSPVRVSWLAEPAKTPLFTDLDSFAFSRFALSRTDQNFFVYPHNNKQNFIFVDGHVESLSKDEIPTSNNDVFWTAGLSE